ncbi:MAG: tetratricopeptide repeat protein, partial [Gammaproteobacteria bacterium]|nr:tetratricopeptide repeat protein [Gammaproteobacteria bacterium]
MTNSIRRLTAVLLAIVLCPPLVHAYEFVPTDSEWQAWPGYCKAKYVWYAVGQRSKFANQVSNIHKQQLVPWEDAGIRGAHHFCAGMIWLKRAWLEQDTKQKSYMLREAANETLFTFNGSSNKSAPQFAYVTIQLARILYEQGEFERSIQTLQSVIAAQPKTDVLYSATAVMQKKIGRLDEAKETLLRGFAALDGASAEINYNLGLIYLELGELDDAVRHAELAYDQGFPLP